LSILTPLRNRIKKKNATALVDITAIEPEQSAEAYSSLVLGEPLSFKFYHQCENVRTIIQSLWVSWTNGNSMSNFDNDLQHKNEHTHTHTYTHTHTHTHTQMLHLHLWFTIKLYLLRCHHRYKHHIAYITL
jgi:hypothetical protein